MKWTWKQRDRQIGGKVTAKIGWSLLVELGWTQVWPWMKQLLQISDISAIHTMKFVLRLFKRLCVDIFSKVFHHCHNFRWAQLLVVYYLTSGAKTAVHSVASKVEEALERW